MDDLLVDLTSAVHQLLLNSGVSAESFGGVSVDVAARRIQVHWNGQPHQSDLDLASAVLSVFDWSEESLKQLALSERRSLAQQDISENKRSEVVMARAMFLYLHDRLNQLSLAVGQPTVSFQSAVQRVRQIIDSGQGD